jgi:SAM-dependent methyltransferase
MTWTIRRLYRSKPIAHLFHTLSYCLDRELSDCETVLDLGCGPNSPIQHCRNLRHTVGVEPFKPYYERALAGRTHSELINAAVQDVDFPPKSFDAVVIIGVIEHMREQDALRTMELAEGWARKKVIVTSPNGYVAQRAVDGNPLQEHLSGWPLASMRRLGFRTRGLAGLKFLRQETDSDTMGDDLLVTIRLRPKPLWFVVAALSQIVTYYVPALAFDLFSVKILSPESVARNN